jgi:hypothetical protein
MMDAKDYLKAIGVIDYTCQNCLREDFQHFIVLSGQVLWCEFCSTMLREKPYLIYDEEHPKIGLHLVEREATEETL